MIHKQLTFLLLFLGVFFSSVASGQVKPIANGQSKFLGCAYSNVQASNFQTYWNQCTPENGGKWGIAESSRGVMNWWEMDAAYNLAQNYHMIFKEHTLIWGAQQPSWIGKLDTASQRQEIEQWFSLLAARYKNIDYIDVVNEPIHNAPNGMLPWGSTTPNVDYAKALGGAGKTGWDWVITSFRMARKYFPNSKLILNEYSVINSSSTTKQYVDIIKLLQADNLIDGIGEQAHAFTTYGTSVAILKTNLDALAATGLPIYLTEMDIDGSTDLIQLKEMQRVFPVFWEHPSVMGITMWGFRIGMWRTKEGANLITNGNIERPALKWLRAYVNESITLTESIAVSIMYDNSSVIRKGDAVNMLATVLPANTTIPNVTWTVTPSDLATIDSNGKLTAIANGEITVTATSWDGSGIQGKMKITIEPPTGFSDKLNADLIKVYPNPSVNGNFTINGIENIKRIELINMVGEKVIEFHHLNQSLLDIQANVPKGMYIINLFDGKHHILKRVIVN